MVVRWGRRMGYLTLGGGPEKRDLSMRYLLVDWALRGTACGMGTPTLSGLLILCASFAQLVPPRVKS